MYFIIQCAKEARACIETRANTSSALCDSTLYFHSAIGLGENNCILIIQATAWFVVKRDKYFKWISIISRLSSRGIYSKL